MRYFSSPLNRRYTHFLVATLFGIGLCPDTLACAPPLPVTESARIMGVGNSFLGRFGSSCRHIEHLLSVNDDTETITGTCDIMYGFPLEGMLDEQVIQNAQSGLYDIGMFISGPTEAMEAFAQLYRDNCMTPILLMTWESLNPANGVASYREGIAAIAQRARDLESSTGTHVIPYGLVLYHLTVNPPPELAHLPVNYLYEPDTPRGPDIHDNAFSFWLKANAMYASLLQRSPEGIPHDVSFYPWGSSQLPLIQSGVLSDQVIRELQRRIWQLTQRWQNGESVNSLMELESDLTPKYELTVGQGSGDGVYRVGAEVTIQADPAPVGWIFDGWEADTEFITSLESATSLIMPTQDIVITARYRREASAQNEYHYLRLEITEIINNGSLHLVEVNWLDSQSQPIFSSMQSNQQDGLTLTTSYPAAAHIYYAFDGNINSRFYLSNQTQNTPIQITLQSPVPLRPSSLSLSVPIWNNNLGGLRCWGSVDGSSWELLLDQQNADAHFQNAEGSARADFVFSNRRI